uniref:Reelin domain-containing protein n=1 Tax=Neogobius melanostomus TaxID=47308 RepID=A0A8C6TRE4_9GOBI
HMHMYCYLSDSSTVTVRSSRDFMGFLLQARRAERVQSPGRMGAALVGGAWTLTPPGTHTIRCVSDGDTVTHSDKQLKRNLSFVWRAPDRPAGDVRFYMTVVQSYFVYWTGIRSPVLHDGTRGRWRGSFHSMLQGFSDFNYEFRYFMICLFQIEHCHFAANLCTKIYLMDRANPVNYRPSAARRSFINRITTSAATLALKTPIVVALPNRDAEANSAVSRISQNTDRNVKPKVEVKAKLPPYPDPDREGKYPDIIPRHSAWELGMLLGCSAGLGMVLVVGVRYVYRQACGKRTQVTLHDREQEYSRGERGLIHLQECGDLVRVRRIRENSFVLLADILATTGD